MNVITSNTSITKGQSINLGIKCIAVGDGIFIPASCYNIMAIGNNITVSENINNVSVINTNNYNVTQSNLSINNGTVSPKWQLGHSAVKKVTATTEVNTSHGTILADASTGNINLTLQSIDSSIITDANGIIISKKYTITKIDATVNTVTVTAFTGNKINGVTTNVLTRQYQSITIQSDGVANWYII
jgi:hypothetical protein